MPEGGSVQPSRGGSVQPPRGGSVQPSRSGSVQPSWRWLSPAVLEVAQLWRPLTVIGWAAASHMRKELCLEALDKALVLRSPVAGFIHHSDRRSQYASNAYRDRLDKAGARCSMSRKGNWWDNAVVESFFGTLKQELVYTQAWPTRRAAISNYLHQFYNPARRHSANGHISPNDQELPHHVAA